VADFLLVFSLRSFHQKLSWRCEGIIKKLAKLIKRHELSTRRFSFQKRHAKFFDVFVSFGKRKRLSVRTQFWRIFDVFLFCFQKRKRKTSTIRNSLTLRPVPRSVLKVCCVSTYLKNKRLAVTDASSKRHFRHAGLAHGESRDLD